MHTSRRTVPKPVRRKGSHTYEVRTRVPAMYRAVVSAGHVNRSLGTRDLLEAKRRVHGVMAQIHAEWAKKLEEYQNGRGQGPQKVPAKTVSSYHVVGKPTLSVGQIRDIVRDKALQNEKDYLREHVLSRVDDPGADILDLVEDYRRRLERNIRRLRVEATVPDFRKHQWLLTYLERSGVGTIVPDPAVFAEMTEANVQALQELHVKWSDRSWPSSLPAQAPPQTALPRLSTFLNSYILERGAGLSSERADTLRANIRDLILITQDKEVDRYDRADARAFKDVLLALPPNWMKSQQLRELDIVTAASNSERPRSPVSSTDEH